MKIYCQNCDCPNDLGHLFCIKCGAKLVLEDVREEIETDGMIERTKSRFLYLLLAIVVIASMIGVVALWAYTPFKRDGAIAGNTDTIDVAISRLQAAAESSKTPFTNEPLKEVDINTWLAAACKRAQAKSLTVRMEPGCCRMRMVFEAGPWKLFKTDKSFGPIAYSRDFTCGVTSNGLVFTSAKFGHLPMVGPLLKYAVSSVSDRFGDFSKERMIFSRVTSMTVDDGTATIAVMSPP